MKGIEDRMKGMSPKKRELLEKLLRDRGIGLSAKHEIRTAAPATDDTELPDRALFMGAEGKRYTQRFYDGFHRKCDAEVFGPHCFFMNLGYLETDSPQDSPVVLPARLPNRPSAKLALEVIGDLDLHGREVLDVGCGRGGTVYVMHEYFSPRRTVGLDLSPNGVAFCRRAHGYPNTDFVVGDAERLPFASGSFDVVTNVESSHSYPDRMSFYREVGRVLRAGGHFLYGDVLSAKAFDAADQMFGRIKLRAERWRDVTENVLRACDVIGRERFGVLVSHQEDRRMADFLSVPGSHTYDGLASGELSFRVARLRKDG